MKLRILEPREGYTLTQVEEVELTARIFSKKIYLAVTDSPENYKEITDEEVEQMMKELEELVLRMEKENQ